MSALHRARSGRRRQVTAVGGVPGLARRHACRSRTLPSLRRGHHVLAGGGDSSSSSPRSTLDPVAAETIERAARQPEARHLERGDRLGLPQAARSGRAGATTRLRVRRPPLGRGDLPRPGRARGRSLPRCADPVALHGEAGSPRPPDRLGRRQGQRHDGAARAACARRDGAPDREPRAAGRAPPCPDPGGRRRQPAVRRGDGRAAAGVGRRRGDRPTDDSGAARGSARSTRSRGSGASSSAARSRDERSTRERFRRSTRRRPS